ncbi:HEAT repeat domain-containing protein [Laspinema olomoucense]|uniref:HEAT repeat domain-containing protein n=1 Tax=Laspinema olomoucense TaxID=3231600 RepID=UPI0021BA4358|nr:HEAT repeat domain-containing protein [Laspinema sp. D3a]MCT7986915.1 HEAT repeat domain-containing protein [Laspinema sp. D3a]
MPSAPTLLSQLPYLSDETLKRDYLNRLQWTDSIANTLAKVADRAEAIRMVKLGFEIDLKLGTKLAGSVKTPFQEEALELLDRQVLPPTLKIRLLGISGSNYAIPYLEKALNDPDYRIRENALEALGAIASLAVVFPLIQGMNDKMPSIRQKSAEILGNLGYNTGIDALILALEDSDRTVPLSAAEALGKIATPVAITALKKVFSNQDYSPTWWSVAVALGKLGDRPALDSILAALNHSATNTRIAAADALGEIGSEETIAALLNTLGDSHEFVRTRAAYGLAKIDQDSVVEKLILALNHPRYLVRESAAIALGEIGTTAAENALTAALTDPNEWVQLRAQQGLERIQAAMIAPAGGNNQNSAIELSKPLEEILDNLADTSSFVREKAAKILGKIGSDRAVESLLNVALTDNTYSVRKTAIEALGNLGTAVAVDALLYTLNEGNSLVRQQVGEVLAQMGEGEIVPLLWHDLFTNGDLYLLDAIASIQARCGYYSPLSFQDPST